MRFSPYPKVRRIYSFESRELIYTASSASREHADTDEFRRFKKQLYHAALAHVLAPLRPWMTAPRVLVCPDGHYRRAIFEIGPFIADYPEQVYVSGVVQGWCPK